MSAPERIQVEAQSDGEDRLLRADEPLSALQIRCGGTIPGAIAVPELRELVSKARGFGLKLARPIIAQDGQETIRAWIEVTPQEGGCLIILRHWQASSLPPEPADLANRRRVEIDRALAELTARLDPGQRLMTVDALAGDLAQVAQAMRGGIGRPWTDFVDVPGSGQRQPLHWRLLDGATVVVPGSQRVWRATILPQTGPEGETLGFDLCLTSDQPLPEPAEPAVAAPSPPSKASSVIGREMAPVLRQPIARIIANAETIRTRRAGPLTEEYAGYAGDIAAAGQHLLTLIEDLSDMEIIEAEGFAPAADRIDLADVARRAAGILGVRAREKGITIHAPDETMHLGAVGEFRRVLQVLLNLIGNAIRYSPENSAISVLLTAGAGRARITIADQGPGLSPQDAARVFDKFERLGRSGDGGSGLGLYISRRLARAMGGELSVEGHQGQGARFVLELPQG
ncbi:sensor histidine kinase [Novosphingobium humi]|uniref:histidine kinase n=1 Tax=Novosphingobium humi TaxID=2282397 RepID=A0ABY7U0C3_9SPHN|nr:HAMP domain-containing sensor histidine kinase [Novosphingobium humi]WCT78221.1 HAMP domain-containing sensor histidine kinase [Novosphingobium humi]WJS98278.1 HAMP domain-containing histidine kinase [Novosphingobium humi]